MQFFFLFFNNLNSVLCFIDMQNLPLAPYLQFQKLPLSRQAFVQITEHAFKNAIVYSD